MIWFVFSFYLLFRWGLLHRVLLVVVWCQVLCSRGFLSVTSHYLILLRVSSEKAMAPHSSTLAWRIPWMEEPGRLQSMGSLRVWDDWATSLSLFTFMHWRRKWQPTPVFLPGESHGRRSLVGCSPWGHEESDLTGWLHFHFSLSCIEGNGNPLQCSCLGNPRDGGACWAAIYGVAQSRTRLMWLSSSSSRLSSLVWGLGVCAPTPEAQCLI